MTSQGVRTLWSLQHHWAARPSPAPLPVPLRGWGPSTRQVYVEAAEDDVLIGNTQWLLSYTSGDWLTGQRLLTTCRNLDGQGGEIDVSPQPKAT